MKYREKAYSIIFLLIISGILTSCISTDRLSKIVYQKKKDFQSSPTIPPNDFISVSCSDIYPQDTFVKTERIKYLFIPAFLYWQWNNDIRCHLDPGVLCQYFTTELKKEVELRELKTKLPGYHLDVRIHKIPDSFIYKNDGFAIILLVAWATGGAEVIIPEIQNFELSYRLSKNDSIMASANISIPGKTSPARNLIKSTKNFTLKYLDQYQDSMVSIIKQSVAQINDEIYPFYK